MPQRSARILNCQSTKRKDPDDIEWEIVETLSPIRKPDEDCETCTFRAAKNQRHSAAYLHSPRSNNTTLLQTASNHTPPSPTIVPVGSFRCFSHTRQMLLANPMVMRASPLPKVSWASHEVMWKVMLQKEALYNTRSHRVMDRHPILKSKMRSTLLDWLSQVSAVYRLHRESFYLATDFFDRYMAVATDVQKGQLQLIGITCLYIAAKFEEISIPELKHFAYVTDGACTVQEIMDLERVILQTLHWDLTPATPCFWLNVYLQLRNYDERKDCLLLSQYSQHAFVQIVQLLDLCVLDIDSLQFRYSVLAAAALYHMSSREIALQASSYSWSDIESCAQWMEPFAMTLHEAGQAELKFFKGIAPDTTHNIQTHEGSIEVLEKVYLRIKESGDVQSI